MSTPEGFSMNEKMSEVVNDFIIPTRREEDRKPGQQFYVRYDRAKDEFFLKSIQDFSIFV